MWIVSGSGAIDCSVLLIEEVPLSIGKCNLVAINGETKAVVATGSREGIDDLFKQVFARRDLSKPFLIVGEAGNIE